ncbi:hemolysin family protein [Pseudohoeflea sp. DP4N28-3]|uniref:Hemolysin family protein n=2 Tax=Pseudohoeflea coraliihabitans TaxID=2860393 RepID=A0ABS6WNV9_9HYPH|nr:hemolysin family protein [Pseudohoeflea sp. DP4N28-3]MBW3097652.1 hemolysin family protein [Pseudohoeflea sp. DP4N28-3]
MLFPPSDGEALRENLTDALQLGGDLHEAFSPGERAMLNNILRLREVRVDDIMVPRADIEAVEESTTIGALLKLFEDSGRSRMPVYSETLDDPRGMIHIRDLLGWLIKQNRTKRRASGSARPSNGNARNGNGRNGNGRPAAAGGARKRGDKAPEKLDLSQVDLTMTLQQSGLVRNVLFVPASMLASDLMQHMQARRIQMALVIDEYGGTDGLVSLEDIVEMVVGDIADEHDLDEENMIKRTGDDIWTADARVELDDLVEVIGSDFDVAEQSEDVDTLGGLIFSELGRIPARGEVVQTIPGFEFQVLDADPRRIKRVRILRGRHLARRRLHRADPASATATGPGQNSASGSASQVRSTTVRSGDSGSS